MRGSERLGNLHKSTQLADGSYLIQKPPHTLAQGLSRVRAP